MLLDIFLEEEHSPTVVAMVLLMHVHFGLFLRGPLAVPFLGLGRLIGVLLAFIRPFINGSSLLRHFFFLELTLG